MASDTPVDSKKIYVTLSGLPLSFHLEWPFQKSAAGADFWRLHCDIRLETSQGLHCPVSVNMSATVREVVPSLDPNDVEGLVINALRKEVDRRQLEFVRSGKLVPVHFSSRDYDFKRNRWVFEKASEEALELMIARKVYWQTRLAGGDVWLGDETESLYVDAALDRFIEVAVKLAKRGWFNLSRRWAEANPALMDQGEKFESDLRAALEELEKKHAFERG
jgi:hypothetical protein